MPKRSAKSADADDPAAAEPEPAASSRRKPKLPSHLVSAGPAPLSEPAAATGSEPAGPPPRAETSRRKQRKPHRLAAETDSFGAEVLIKAEPASTSTPPSTASLMSSLKCKRAPKPRQVLPKVACGVCKENVNERAFERHTMSQHNGLARPSGESQEFTKTEKVSIFNRILKSGLKLQCPLCKKCLTSAMGFFHHHNQCGKEIQPVKCPKCDWFFKPLSLPQHMRNHERRDAAKQDGDTAELPAKRQRRSRQSTKLADSTDSDHVPEAENGETNVTKRGYSVPRTTPHPAQVAKWRRSIGAAGKAHCELPSCTFSTTVTDEMVLHFPDCRSMPSKWKSFCCESCKKRTASEAEMVRHVKSFHPYCWTESESVARSATPLQTTARGKRGRQGTVTPDMGSELTYFTPVERQADPRHHAQQYWSKQVKSRALTSVRLDMPEWWLCSTEEQNCYGPPMKLSPAYKVQQIGAADPYRSYERLEIYASEELDNGVVCFCGGPVTGCDWCPRPEAADEEPQYLAVSCLAVVDRDLPPTQPSGQPSAVQLWSFTNDRRSCRMEYAVCVDGGPVWDLVWCPVATRTPSSVHRLGSLALACGDGRIRVYVMPTPDRLPHDEQHQNPFYIKRPDMRLEAYGDMGRSPCCRLDWAKTDGNRTVTGIFGNGTVVIWDITATSPILTHKDGTTRVMYPVQVLAAHKGHGTALAMCPSGDRFLCSGGRDRTLQLWDREEPAPLQRATNKLRPMLTDLCWPIATKKIVNAYDHSLFTGSPTVMMSDAALPVQDVPFFTHSAKCTSVSVNTAINGLACGSESGLVALTQWRSMLSHKLKAELRRLLLRVDAEKMTAHASGDELLLGDKFMQIWESCGITIWEAKLNGRTGTINTGFDENNPNTGSWVSNYPLVAVNKVCWNRNKGTDSWLAVGMECGMLRVLEVPNGAFAPVRS